jgi:hypothetical protein
MLGQVEYLFIEVDEDDTSQESDALARQYVEMFRKHFKDLRVLRIETIGDRNFTKMLRMMMADPTFPWFDMVHTIKVYQVRNL